MAKRSLKRLSISSRLLRASRAKAIEISKSPEPIRFNAGGSAEIVAYVGHNGLMDFTLHATPVAHDERKRKAIVLACANQNCGLAGANKLFATGW